MARLPSLLTLLRSRLRSAPRWLARWPRAAIVVALCALVVSTVGAGLLVVHITHAGSPTTLYVNDGPSGSDSNDCLSAASPCLTIQHAVDLAAPGATINIAPNIYAGGITITQDVTLQGAGAEETAIDGGSPVVNVPVGTVTLMDLTVVGGSGGIRNSGTLTVSDSVVRNNSASFAGGGISNAGTLTVTDSVVSDNSGGNQGGGISNAGTLTVTDSVVRNNSAGQGGGIYSDGALTVTNSTISDNSATSGNGGGIYIIRLSSNPTLTVSNSSISDNSARSGGGGVADLTGGTLTISDSTLNGNSAGFRGGGLDNGSTLTLVNSTLSGNSASSSGGGIFNGGTLALTNSTVSDNSSPPGIGGIDGAATLGNTVVAGNTNSGEFSDCNGPLSDATSGHGNNLISVDNSAASCGLTNGSNGDQVGSSLSLLDPLLNALAANGGPTLTMRPGSGSPLLNAGYGPTCPSTDQRGYSRDTSGRGNVCDIGAYDYGSQATPVNSTGSYSTVYVNNGPSGSDGNDCASAASPCLTIAHALSLVSSGGTVVIAANLYPAGITLSGITLSKSVTFQGAGVEETAIYGGAPVLTVNSGTSVTLTGLTVMGGTSGGIQNNGTLTLTDSAVSDNTSSGNGGGISNGGSAKLSLTDSVVSGNSVSGSAVGGGIANGGTLTITDSAISDNTVSGSEGGGGVHNGGTLTLTSSTISGNSAAGPGGGLQNTDGGTLTITNSTISGNSVSANGGGGIQNAGGTLTIASSTISGNTAPGGNGGGIQNVDTGTLTLTNSTISGNNSTSADRLSGNGGGIYNQGGSLTLTNSTISGNSSAYPGSAGIDGAAALDNTVVAANTANTYPSDCNGPLSDATSGHGNNFIGIGTGCGLTDGSNGDQVGSGTALDPLGQIFPKLNALSANGGPTLTMQPQSSSPLVAAGYVPTCASTGATGVNDLDQRGYSRRIALINACTIGAYELGTEASVTTLSVSPSGGNSVFGQTLTLTVTVAAKSGTGLGTPTGNVTFYLGSTSINPPVTLDGSGKASLTFSGSDLAVGSYTLSAQYGGDTNYNPSASNSVAQQVNQISTTTTLVVSPASSVNGQTVTLTASVAAVAPGSGTPTGGVSFYVDGNPLLNPFTKKDAWPLNGNGQATLTTSTLAIGTHALQAVYGGATDYAGSTGTASALVSAATPPPAGSSDGYVRFVQATLNDSLDISIDGSVVYPNVARYAVQPYVPIAAGTHSVVIDAPSGVSTQIASGNINVVAGQYQTVLISGGADAGSGKLVAIVDNLSVSSGQAQVRVYNAQSDTSLSYTYSSSPTASLGTPGGHSVVIARTGSSGAMLALAHLPALAKNGASTQQSAIARHGASATSEGALSAASAFSVAPGTLTVTISPDGGSDLTDALALSANQAYSIFVFDDGVTPANAVAPGVPTGLPQTGVGPAHSPFLPWLLGLLAILGAGAASWYLLLYRPGRSLDALVGWLGEGQRQRLSAAGDWLRRRLRRQP